MRNVSFHHDNAISLVIPKSILWRMRIRVGFQGQHVLVWGIVVVGALTVAQELELESPLREGDRRFRYISEQLREFDVLLSVFVCAGLCAAS